MKKIVLLVITMLIITGCGKDDISYSSEYETSYRAWLKYKESTNDSYSYTVNAGSVFGFGSETTLVISNGKVISRMYTAKQIGQGPGVPTTILKTWTEDLASLNTHANEGAATITLDEVYKKAKDVWLSADRKNNDLYFEARNNGLISLCGYVPKGCQDDCLTGISISNITEQNQLYAPNK